MPRARAELGVQLGDRALEAVLGELARAPGAREPAARVGLALELDDEDPRQLAFREDQPLAVLPDHPRALAPGLHAVERDLVLEGVHRLPEAHVAVAAEQALLEQAREGLLHQLLALVHVVEDLGAHHEEAAVDAAGPRRASVRAPSPGRPRPPPRSGSSARSALRRSSRRAACARTPPASGRGGGRRARRRSSRGTSRPASRYLRTRSSRCPMFECRPVSTKVIFQSSMSLAVELDALRRPRRA